MKIDKIIINNFRIFNGRYEFDLTNKDLVIISGPNGNGKSTVFDSIQWCFTGKIPRYEGSNERQKFNYLMNEYTYKQVGPQFMSVEVWVRPEKGFTHKICRMQKKNRAGKLETPEIIIDDEPLNLTIGAERIGKILSNIEFEEIDEKKQEKVLNLSTFFSSTQLLSQDALHNFIRADKPSERYKLIDKVLGVKKYGEEFEQFVELTKLTAQEQLEQLESELKPFKDEKERLIIQLTEKEKLFNSIGAVNEQELLKKTKEVIADFVKAGIKLPEAITSIQKLNNEVIEALVNLRLNGKNEQENTTRLKLSLQDPTELMSLTSEMYKQEKDTIHRSLDPIYKRIDRRNQGQEIIRRRQITLNSLKIRRENYQETLKEYNTLAMTKEQKEVHLQRLLQHSALKKAIELFPEIDKFPEIYEQGQQDLKVLNTYFELQELNESVNKLKNEINDGLSTLEEKKQTYLSKDANLTDIIQSLNDIDYMISDNKTSIIDEIIRQVQGHLLQNEVNQICPVCGSDFSSSQTLRESISNQIDKKSMVLSEHEKQRLNLIQMKSTLEEEIKNLAFELKQLENLIKEKEESVSSKAITQEIVRSKIPEDLFNLSLPELQSKFLDFEKFLREYKITYDVMKSIQLIELDIKNIDEEMILKLQVLENLKKESKHWAIYLEKEQIVIDKRLQLINNYLYKTHEQIVQLDGEKQVLINGLTILEKRWEQRNQKITEIKKWIPNFAGKIPEIEYWSEHTTSKLDSLSHLDVKLGAHLSNLKIFLTKDEVLKLKNDLNILDKTVTELEQQIKNYNEFINTELNYLKKEHISVQSNLIGDYLLQHSDYVDHLFMQISPHAVYRHVQLVPKEKNLYVVMTKQSAKEYDLRNLKEDRLKQQFNASLTFSSAQANVLAICIFLALNRSQTWTKLKLLGIDDPFQNLDDINVFSFIDVLSQVIETQNKQVLISTHSEDFAHLMKVKMHLKPEQIGTILFKSYSENGAVVTGNCVS